MENREHRQPTLKHWILGLLGAFLVLWIIMDWPCLFRQATGFPCLGCGLSRAWLSVFKLDFSGAFRNHPMFWSIPVLALYYLRDGNLFSARKQNSVILALIITGWLVSYAIRLFFFLKGDSVF